MPRQGNHGSIAHLLGELTGDIRLLIRQQLSLARAEVREELKQARLVVVLAAMTAGLFGTAGLWMLVAVTRGVADLFNWPVWAGYALVGVLLGLAGAVLSVIVWHQLQELTLLPKTKDTLKEHMHWLGERVASAHAETES